MPRFAFILFALCIVISAACGSEDDKPAPEMTPDMGECCETDSGRLEATPGEVEFDEFVLDVPQRKSVTLTNVGEEPLTIMSIELVEETLQDSNEEFLLPDPFREVRLAPSDSFTFAVRYLARDETRDRGEIVVRTDVKNGDLTIPVLGPLFEPEPAGCVRYPDVEGLNFRLVEPGSEEYRTYELRNCSDDTPLVIKDIRFDPDDIDFSVRTETLQEAEDPDALGSIAPGESATLLFVFEPNEESTHRGQAFIETNDPENEAIRVGLLGYAYFRDCPEAVATASVDGTNYAQVIQATPTTTVKLSGLDSFSRDGSNIVRYEWNVFSRPRGSSSSFFFGQRESAEPEVFLDVAGRYEFGVTVWDENDRMSCGLESYLATVEVIPGEQIYIDMFWSTPTDADQQDSRGTDLDLHYRRSGGEWFDPAYDVFWDSAPDWGASGPQDDPRYPVNDQDGAGPERIQHNPGQISDTYSVGVHYRSDLSLGPSYPSVRIYINGTLQLELLDYFLAGSGFFWHAADISWPSGQVVEIDDVSELSR